MEEENKRRRDSSHTLLTRIKAKDEGEEEDHGVIVKGEGEQGGGRPLGRKRIRDLALGPVWWWKMSLRNLRQSVAPARTLRGVHLHHNPSDSHPEDAVGRIHNHPEGTAAHNLF